MYEDILVSSKKQPQVTAFHKKHKLYKVNNEQKMFIIASLYS